MKKILKYKLSILFLFLFLPLQADDKFKFANMDTIIKKTEYGIKMLNKIDQLDKENVSKLKAYEDDLKKLEKQINLKKNVVSEIELDKEIKELKLKINSYKQEKDLMVKKLNQIKNNELKIFFNKVNPIIQNYMNKNSIQILFNSKNVIMGNKNADLTDVLIQEINSKI